MLGSDRRADAPIRPKAALMQGARLPKQPEQTQTQTPSSPLKACHWISGPASRLSVHACQRWRCLRQVRRVIVRHFDSSPFKLRHIRPAQCLLRDMRGSTNSTWSGPPNLSTRSSSANARNEGIRYNAPSQGVMQSKPGGTMLSPEGLNMMARPNTVYAETARLLVFE